MRYGVPYKGSKNKIAKDIIEQLPEANYFVDLFAGGCAITHAAMLSGKYKRFIVNDISSAPKLFTDAVDGKYASEKRWISREDFFRLKDSDDYVKYCWSFGTNGSNYLYSKEIEPWKKALHYARVFKDFSLLSDMGIDSDGSRADMKAHKEEYKDKYIRWWLSKQEYSSQEIDSLIKSTKEDIERDSEGLRQYLLAGLKSSGLTQAEVQRRLGTQMAGHYFGRSQWAFPTQEMYEKMQEFMPYPTDYMELTGLWRLRQSLQSLESLESLESLQSLESLESLQRLQRLQSDYKAVEIPKNSVIYCDIPYRGTNQYDNVIDYEEFYEWCHKQTAPVFVSEYWMPEDRFVAVWEKPHRSSMNGKGSRPRTIEKLFRPV